MLALPRWWGCISLAEAVASTRFGYMQAKRVSPLNICLCGATPRRVGFGAFQGKVCPHARYSVKVGGVWRSVPFTGYRGGTSQFWSLAVGRSRAAIPGPTEVAAEGPRIVSQPGFLQHGGAQCLLDAVGGGVPQLGAGLAGPAKGWPYAIICEGPASASSDIRKKRGSFPRLPAGVLGLENSCAGHQGHRMVEACGRELSGHFHAVFVASPGPSSQGKNQQPLRSTMRGMNMFIGKPGGSWTRRDRDVMKCTLLRRKHRIEAGHGG